MRTTAHLAHQALLLHLAAELAQCLLELLLVLDDYLQAFTFSVLGCRLREEAHPGYATSVSESSRPNWVRFPSSGRW